MARTWSSGGFGPAPVDPAPRTYSASITLLRRAEFDRASFAPQTPVKMQAWRLDEALATRKLTAAYQEFLWRMEAAGLQVARSGLHVGRLRPQLFGDAWMRNYDAGFCDEIIVGRSVLTSEAHCHNPLFGVIGRDDRFRTCLEGPRRDGSSPLMGELADAGFTEYAAFPLSSGGASHNAAAIATTRPGGFADADFEHIGWPLRVFALHVERHIAERISWNIVTTYLGKDAGRQVLDGSIRRRWGAAIDAVIWVSDLRRFTAPADRLGNAGLTAVLDANCDCLAGAVIDLGGDVLKFIGNGLLAVFPFAQFPDERAAAWAAITAARAALQSLDALNADPSALPEAAGWRALRAGIALHRGAALFGNVGSVGRLEFTVIGTAVNISSRVEGCAGPPVGICF